MYVHHFDVTDKLVEENLFCFMASSLSIIEFWLIQNKDEFMWQVKLSLVLSLKVFFAESGHHHHHHHHHVVPLARVYLPSLGTSPYRSSSPAGLQGYIPYLHIGAVCMF